MITKIQIKRFKIIGDISLEISSSNLIIGGNNSGKTSVLQAVQFAVSAAQTTGLQNSCWRSDKLSTSIAATDLLYSPLKDVAALSPNRHFRENFADGISVTLHTISNSSTVSIIKGRNKNIQIKIEGEILGRQLQSIEHPFVCLVPGLAGIPSYEEYETPLMVRRAAAKGDSNSVFRNILLQLSKTPDKWKRFQSNIQELFPGLKIEVSFDENLNETIQATVIENGVQLPIDSAGTGVLQAIQIFSYIELYKPKLLLLDEPDSHLHPNNQRILSNIIAKIASSNETQILISSHSLYLIDSLLENSKTFWLKDGAIQEETNNHQILCLMEIGALNQAGGFHLRDPKLVVVSEDEKEEVLKHILKSVGFNLKEIEFWSYKGCTNISTLDVLVGFISQKIPNAHILIHRDRDFLPQEMTDDFANKFENDKVTVYIPSGNDLESLFCNKEHLSILLEEPDLNFSQELIKSAITLKKDELVQKFINTRVDQTLKQGKKPDSGKIAVECMKLFNSAPHLYSHGKILVRSINNIINDQLKKQINILVPSPGIKAPLLEKLVKSL